MKNYFLSILLIIGSLAFGSETIKSSADSAYKAHDYKLAINLFSQLLSDHQKSAPIYFNLGNAYFKNNEIGKAIWAYQKSKKIDPKNKDVIYNLNYASALTKDEIEQNDSGISKWMAKVFFGRSINFWALMAFISVLIGAVCFYFFKIITAKNKRGIFLICSLAFAFIFALCFALSIAHHSHISSFNNGIIINAVVKVNTAPNTEEAVAFELHEGAKFTHKQTQGNWLRIEVGKNEGWIEKSNALLY